MYIGLSHENGNFFQIYGLCVKILSYQWILCLTCVTLLGLMVSFQGRYNMPHLSNEFIAVISPQSLKKCQKCSSTADGTMITDTGKVIQTCNRYIMNSHFVERDTILHSKQFN